MYSVEMTGIVKRYKELVAVDHVDFGVKQGEVHCLLGENGAGKTTLMKILYGMTKPDEGQIRIDGSEAVIRTPQDAIRFGIGMVHQHFQQAPVMTVAENIVVGQENQPFFHFSRKKAISRVDEIIREYGFSIDSSRKVEELSVGEQQRVEIIKALYRNARILILDEPTAVLTPQEVEELFLIIENMRSAGKSIIIITHKLKEAIRISNHVSVMRSGVMIERDIPTAQCTVDILARKMVGRKLDFQPPIRVKKQPEIWLSAEHISLRVKGVPVLKDVSLSIGKGEILGIAGVEGNGQTELIEVLTGITRPDSMHLTVGGKELKGTVRTFINRGIGHIPEDRQTRGLIGAMSVKENLILGYHAGEQFSGKWMMKAADIGQFADQVIEKYEIKTAGQNSPVSALSGGNQQKVVVGRIFSQTPEVIIAAQPTRGIDVGSQEFIHHMLLELRDQGAAILLISADLDEVLYLSDRVSVLYEGEIVKTVPADTLSEEEIGILMLGGSLEEKEAAADEAR